MDNTSYFDTDEASQQSRSRYLLAIFLKLLWTSLTLLVLLGVLLPLTIFLGWWTFILPCLIGLLAVLTLPGLAVYLSFMAVSSPKAFDASSSALMPFVAYALATIIGGLIMVKIWQNMPVRERNEKVEKEPVPVLPQAKKEHTSHAKSDLDKAS